MPLDIANLDAPESEVATQPADASGAPGDGANGKPDAGTPDTGTGGADPADAGDAGGNDGGEAGDGGGDPEPPVKGKPATVPHAALHEAREQNKQLKARIAELEALPRLDAEDMALLKELRAQRAQKQPPKEGTEEQPPDFLEDPKGYVDAQVKAALKKLEETGQETKQTKEQLEQHQMMQAVIQTASAQVDEFVKQTTDYPQAVEFARTLRGNQLKAIYRDATPQQIAQAVAAEEIQLARQLVMKGENFAEWAYGYAKSLGYQPPKPAEEPKPKKPDASAVRSLGSGGADTELPESDADDPMSEFRDLQKEVRARFKRRA